MPITLMITRPDGSQYTTQSTDSFSANYAYYNSIGYGVAQIPDPNQNPMSSDLSSSGNPGTSCPASVVSTFQSAITGIAATQSKYPTLMAQRINLTMADVMDTIQEGRANGTTPVFTL